MFSFQVYPECALEKDDKWQLKIKSAPSILVHALGVVDAVYFVRFSSA